MWRTFLAEINYIPFVYCNPYRCLVEVHSFMEGCLACLARFTHVVSSVMLKRNLWVFWAILKERPCQKKPIWVCLLQNFGTPLNPSNGPMNSTCAKDLRGCSLNDTVFACSVCHCAALSTFVGKSWQWWWHCAEEPALVEIFRNSGRRLIPMPPRGAKINLYPPKVMSFSLSVTSKSLSCTFETDLLLTALLVVVAWKEKSQ